MADESTPKPSRMARMVAAEKELAAAFRSTWLAVSDVADELETERDRLMDFMKAAGMSDRMIDYVRESAEPVAVKVAKLMGDAK